MPRGKGLGGSAAFMVQKERNERNPLEIKGKKRRAES
jgi:hypothetical protein